jgi:Domain of Unknown Function (DUF928)
MKRKNVFSTVALLGVLLPAISIAPIGGAQAQEIIRLADSYAARIGFVPPADDGTPRSTRSGASRTLISSTCGALPLLPESGLSLTTDEQLSLYTYFAKGSTVSNVILNVKSADQSEYYETSVSLPADKFVENGGVIEIKVDDALPALKTGEEYSWSMVLVCDGQLRPRPDSPVLTGAVERVEPVLAAQAADMPLAEQAKMYGEAGLWHDLLSTLALMRIENPNDAQSVEHWSEVLKSVGLDDVAEAALIL